MMKAMWGIWEIRLQVLTESANMFPSNEMASQEKTLRDLQRIEELNINEERIIETEAKIANLQNLEAIGGRDASVNIKKELGSVGINWRN